MPPDIISIYGDIPLLERGLKEASPETALRNGTFAQTYTFGPADRSLVLSLICHPSHLESQDRVGRLRRPSGTAIPYLSYEASITQAERMITYAEELYRVGGDEVVAFPLALGVAHRVDGRGYIVSVSRFFPNVCQKLLEDTSERRPWPGLEALVSHTGEIRYGYPFAWALSILFSLFEQSDPRFSTRLELEVPLDGQTGNLAHRCFDLFPPLLRLEDRAVFHYPPPEPGTRAYRNGYWRAFTIGGVLTTFLTSACMDQPIYSVSFWDLAVRYAEMMASEKTGREKQAFTEVVHYLQSHPARQLLEDTLGPEDRRGIIDSVDIPNEPYIARSCWCSLVGRAKIRGIQLGRDLLRLNRWVRFVTSAWQYEDEAVLTNKAERLRHLLYRSNRQLGL
jgi:hypothetical protein